ncbi:MAG: AraC family transcriptional regulator [Saprospiraceae bacterium]
MGRIITWTTTPSPANKPSHETDSLFFGENVSRYMKFTPTYSARLCLRGTMPFLVEGKEIMLRAGELLLSNNDLEMECLPASPDVQAVAVFFSTELLGDVASWPFSEHGLLDEPNPETAPLRFFEMLYRQANPFSGQLQGIASEMATTLKPAGSLGKEVFFDLAVCLYSLHRESARKINQVKARTPATRQELFRRVLAARDFMHDQCDAPLTLEEVAQSACLSPYHFHRTFQEVFGTPPMRWLKKRKMEKAREWLLEGRFNISEVAYRSGFADVAGFSKAFKRTWGKCPSAYVVS